MSMKTKLSLLVGLASLSGAVLAAPQKFDFKDPKGVNNIVFQLDAPLESINGTANGISGEVTFDPDAPGSINGKVILATASLHVGNPMQKEHLHGDNWMDVAKHPEIIFEALKAEKVKTSGNETTADVSGKLTVKGVTKAIMVPVRITYLKDRLKDRIPNKQGDLLVLRAKFSIKRSDFNINPRNGEDKVSDEIQLSLSLAGMAAR
jgi:polyisoprenoid-binding protein YceI